MKLLTKGIVIISIGTVAVSICVFLFSFFSFRNIVRQSVGKEQSLVTRQAFQRVEQFLFWRFMQAKLLGTSVVYKDLLLEKKVSEVDLMEVTTNFQTFNGPWDIVIVVDKNGEAVFSNDRGEIGENIKDDPNNYHAFSEAMKGREYYSDVVISEEVPRPTMIFAIPVRANNEPKSKIIGVVIAQLTWQAVLEILEDVQGIDLTLYNRDGYIIGSNNINRQKDILKVNRKNYPVFDFLLTKDYPEVLPSLNGDYQVLITHFHEAGYFDYFGNNWILAGEVPEKQAFALAEQSAINESLTMIIIVVLSGIFFMLALIRIVINPIIALRRVAQKIAAGDYSRRAKILAQDEIGDLAKDFNSMTEILMRVPEKLEKTVKEKTEELSKKVVELEDSRRAILNVVEDLDSEKEQLQKEKNKDEAILFGIGDGVFVLDKNLKILVFNKVASEISGYTSREVIGKRYDVILKFFNESDGTPNNKFIENVFKTGQVQKMANHTVLQRKDGTSVAVADSAAPLKGTKGTVEGCVVVFRDVTKERELDRAKTEFVSLASHQLRTPLTSIKWYGEMLMQEDLKEKERQSYIKQIYSSNERMIELVNALLNVSRVEMGTMIIEPQPINIKEVADIVMGELLSQIKQKKIKLNKIFDSVLPKISIDQKLIKIVFQNLLSNAVKYTPVSGKIDFEIKKKDEKIFIRVQDSGIGIPNNEQAKVFSKFFRADNAREMDPDGTGLGLYIVKSFLEKVGGRVWFESALKKGTAFYVTLPIKGIAKNDGKK